MEQRNEDQTFENEVEDNYGPVDGYYLVSVSNILSLCFVVNHTGWTMRRLTVFSSSTTCLSQVSFDFYNLIVFLLTFF